MAAKKTKLPEPVPDATPFCALGREAQLRTLVAQRIQLRAEMRKYLANLAYWNQSQADRGEPGLGRDRQVEAQLNLIETEPTEAWKAAEAAGGAK